jgi:hypothetical protein
MPGSVTDPKFPYIHLGSSIRAEWVVKVNGESVEPEEGATFDLTDLSPDDGIQISFSVRIETAKVMSSLDEDESVDEVAEMHVIVKPEGNEAARLRCAITADEGPEVEGGELVWSGDWAIVRRELAGNVCLSPSLTRKVPGRNQGLARFPGEELAGAENQLSLRVAEGPAPSGESLEVVWMSFSKDLNVEEFKDAVWSLADLDAGNDPPILRLNKDIEDLQSLLEGSSKRGYRAKRKEVLNSLIASHVWAELASLVLNDLAMADEEAVDGGLLDEDDWRFRLLADLASASESGYSEMSEREAVAALVEQCKQERGIAGVADRIDAWAQKSKGLGDKLSKMAEAGDL